MTSMARWNGPATAAATLGLIAFTPAASADTYPSHQITMVVPFAAAPAT